LVDNSIAANHLKLSPWIPRASLILDNCTTILLVHDQNRFMRSSP
jgi:hypothetical protein